MQWGVTESHLEFLRSFRVLIQQSKSSLSGSKAQLGVGGVIQAAWASDLRCISPESSQRAAWPKREPVWNYEHGKLPLVAVW